MNITRSLLSLAVASLSSLPLRDSVSAAEPDAVNKPNIIVVFTDDQGWADLGVHGAVPDIKTPHLDELAKSGIRFDSGYITAPQCIPSRAGLLSGRYQQKIGVDDNRYAPMPTEVKTMAEYLRDAGYRTGMVGKWHLDPNVQSDEWLKANVYQDTPLPEELDQRKVPGALRPPFLPRAQGFTDFFEGYIHAYNANYALDGKDLSPDGEMVKTTGDRLDTQTEAALAFLSRVKGKPFFLYLSYFAPHVPLASSEKYLSRFPGEMPERRRYALAMISAVDEGVGRVRARLQEMGVAENTLIFFISDNGAPLKMTMEDLPISNPGGAWDGSLNTPLAGEKGMLAEGGIRVPFLMSWPARIESGQVSKMPVTSLDVAATSLAGAGIPIPEEFDGNDILSLLADPGSWNRPLYWRFWGQGALRQGDYKYLRVGNRELLFDVAKDAQEENDLSASDPERTEKMRKQWEQWNAELIRPFDGADGSTVPQEKAWYNFYFNIKL